MVMPSESTQSVHAAREARYLGLLRWCHRRRLPLIRPVLRAYRRSAKFQLSPGEIAMVLGQLRKAGNFLVFGVGRDTPMWVALGPEQTHFLEDDPAWIAANSKWTDRIHRVHYSTVLEQYRELLHRPEALELDLPSTVAAREWDLILVDAPYGFEPGRPGRMQSIYAASRLVRPGGVVLVHDMDREVEQLYASAFLGPQSRRVGRMAMFRAIWNACPPFPPAKESAGKRLPPTAPADEIPSERIFPYYRDERVEINIVNFDFTMPLRPRHEREVLLVRDPWYPERPRLSAIRYRLRNPTCFPQVYYLSNTELFHRWRRAAGFNSHFINIGCFIDEHAFQPATAETAKTYDAVMIGRFSWRKHDQLKRHYLAAGVDRLALLDPIYESESRYYRKHYQQRPNCAYFNLHRLSPGEVAGILHQSCCGLILSAHEGVCRASSEYLLCGLPVVSTPSAGGRDVWYDEYNAVIVQPEREAVEDAVLQLRQSPRDPWRIRDRYLQQAETFRLRFIRDVLEPVFRRYGVSRAPREVFDSHPFRWWP